MAKEVKDRFAGIIAFVFTEDQKRNPMPPHRANILLRKIREILHISENKKKY